MPYFSKYTVGIIVYALFGMLSNLFERYSAEHMQCVFL